MSELSATTAFGNSSVAQRIAGEVEIVRIEQALAADDSYRRGRSQLMPRRPLSTI